MLVLNTQLKEAITFWPPLNTDDYGNTVLGAPVLLKGRWEDKTVLMRTPQGDEFQSQAVVYVSEDVVQDGYLAKGSYPTVTDPTTVGGLEIKAFSSIPDLRNLVRERKAIL